MPASTSFKYKKHLENLFEYLSSNGDIASGCPQIGTYAASLCKRIRQQTDGENWALKIGPWIIPIKEEDDNLGKSKACLTIYGYMEAEKSKLTQISFSAGVIVSPGLEIGEKSCCDKLNRGRFRLIRLFRFENCKGYAKTAETCFHVHYGGDPHEQFMEASYHHCLESWLKKPRIPFPPYDFPLFLEFFLRQFKLGVGDKFFSEPFWVNFIRESENFVLAKYYEKISIYLAQRKKTTTLLGHLCFSGDDLLS